MALDYSTKDWSLKLNEEYHQTVLVHNGVSTCFIRELGGTDVTLEPVGAYKLGEIVYQVYTWDKAPTKEQYERIYFATENAPAPKVDNQATFSANVPIVGEKTCISGVEKVLAT